MLADQVWNHARGSSVALLDQHQHVMKNSEGSEENLKNKTKTKATFVDAYGIRN